MLLNTQPSPACGQPLVGDATTAMIPTVEAQVGEKPEGHPNSRALQVWSRGGSSGHLDLRRDHAR